MKVNVNEFEETMATLVSTTNTQLKRHEGLKGILNMRVNGSAYIENPFEYLYTSTVQEIDIEKDIITMRTMNSIYVFKKTDDAMTLSDLYRE